MIKMIQRVLIGVFLLAAAHARADSAAGQLVIVSTPPGAVIVVDGKELGLAPQIARGLLPGDHLVEARWSDGRSTTMVQKVAGGTSQVVQLVATGDAPKPPPPLVLPAAPPAATPNDLPPSPGTPPAANPPPVINLPAATNLPPSPTTPPPEHSATTIAPGEPAPVPPPPSEPVKAATPDKNENAVTQVPPPHKPFYKKAWFWAVVGVAAVGVVAIGLGAGLSHGGNTRYGIAEF